MNTQTAGFDEVMGNYKSAAHIIADTIAAGLSD